MGKILVAAALLVASQVASASELVLFSDPSGLSAEAEFSLLDDGMTLEVRLRNTSTDVPDGFDNSDQILTGISWDFGEPGFNSDPEITGGTVRTGPNSMSINFDILDVGPDEDVSGEWGFGNMDGTGALTNFITANNPVASPFGGQNLDGPVSIDGPQGGVVGVPILIDLGGLGAIQDEIIATLTLSEALDDLGFLTDNGARVEFGSDAFFIPEPASLGLLLLGAVALFGRRLRNE
ncbi:MAG: PEP-CTERM sorting domain-containing protein [Planctomycetes bacterium]|nr:PEP-CTERM sorting domain-containing protein [Planctomycetota bacterium]